MIWLCHAWIVGRGYCGAPATIIDPVIGGPVCANHRRTAAVQAMVCQSCGHTIRAGERYEFVHGIEKRRQDGTDPLICEPCRARLLRDVVAAFAAYRGPTGEEGGDG